MPLRYAFEPRQGRSAALNCGIGLAEGEIIVTTDDDVRVSKDWLTNIAAALEDKRCDYVGGRVAPLFESPPPRWFPTTPGLLWGVIALLDYGPVPVRFGRRVPLGVKSHLDFSSAPHIGGVPRYMFRGALIALRDAVAAAWRGHSDIRNIEGWVRTLCTPVPVQ